MDIIRQLNWRYATKAFDNDKIISQSKIDILIEAFNLTASSYGLQPYKLVLVKNKKLQEDLVEYSMNQKQIAQASHVLIFCIETTVNKSYIVDYFERIKTLRGTPDDILNSFRTFMIDEFESMSQKDIYNWAKNQAYLAMGNLLTICALHEIDACPMEGFIPEKYDALLGLEAKGIQSVLVLPIGYRSKNDTFADFKKVRKPLNEVIITL